MPSPLDCPILVWMLSMNRETTVEEYDICYKLVQETMTHVKLKYAPESHDNFLQVVSQMMPLLMMRHRRVPRAMWRDRQTPLGKHWIEQDPAGMPPEKFMRSMIGYNLAYDTSLIGMAMVQGTQREVVNVGFGMKKLAVEPADATVAAYIESLAHKITPHEQSLMSAEPNEDAILRRLTILLAMKQAYIRAIGQPLGFDWSRLEFDVPNRSARGDDLPLSGWEFRVFTSKLGVLRGPNAGANSAAPSPTAGKDPAPSGDQRLTEETYVCCVAFFRGTRESKFDFHETTEQLESWVQFINIDQMLKVVPKLTA